MRLKALELQGFKTFPDKTKLTFEDGISAVVGPNGSGKSNISDAVRWVLGEQSAKALRCVKMEDVIFSGTPERKAQGFAEVTLTIDNESRYLPYDGDTVSVTRRYYRSGDSEYLINKATVRLKDIHELFMDTGLGRDGYSMIGQGKIDAIISAKSEERREIFEEAAGISRYRYRKEESERKLARAEENLLRLQDIVSELEGRIGPLKEQSDKAKTYLELYQEKRKLEIGLWLYTLNQSGKILQEHEGKLLLIRQQHDEADAEAERLDHAIEELFQKTNECLVQGEQARKESADRESESVACEGRVSVLETDLRHSRETTQRLTEEQLKHGESEARYREELSQRQAQIASLDETLQQQNRRYRESEDELSSLRTRMDDSTGKLDLANDQLRKLAEQKSQSQLAAMQASSTAQELSLRMDRLDEDVRRHRERYDALVLENEKIRQSAVQSEQREAEKREQLQAAERALNESSVISDELKRKRDSLYLDLQETSRRAKILEDLERSMEGFAHSIKLVMRMAESGELSGVHGPVSRLLEVPKQYAVAIETALGGSAQHIVVSSENDAKAAIAQLKRKDGGRATFLPISTIRGRTLSEPNLEKQPGFLGIAGELCQCDKQYDGILQSLLGRIVVAETLDHAVAIAKAFRYQFRVVTLDGQVVNASGSLTGGSLARKNGLLSRSSDIEALKEKGCALQTQYEAQNRELAENQRALEQLQTAVAQSRNELTEASSHRLETAGHLRQAESDLLREEQRLQELLAEKSTANSRHQELCEAKRAAERSMQSLDQETLHAQAELGKLNGGRTALQQESERLNGKIQELRFSLLTLEKDRETLTAAANELREKIDESVQSSRETAQQLSNLTLHQSQLEQEIEKTKQEAQALRERSLEKKREAEVLQTKRFSLEQEMSQLRALEKERSATKETIGRELTRLEERKISLQKKYDEIIEQLWSEYELTRREAEAESQPVENENESAKRLRELKNQIKSLGSVNVDAIEEYREVSERYEFLTAQVDDVEKSKAELHRLIRDLTRQMTEIFKERFAEINGYFKTTFTELFGGGSGHLELDDPENVLQSGITIIAQPPGKIVKNLELLSGGEKALVAVSLYFSIMKVSPPPFCMLDEIEAALDDVNVVRFADYLRRMNKNTQFIVITHRRGTMEEADVLYGVTMQDEGISKLLKLDPKELGHQPGIQ